MSNNGFGAQDLKSQQQIKIKHKNPHQSRESNQGHLAPAVTSGPQRQLTYRW